MKRKRILFIIHSLTLGGLENYLLRFCRYVRNKPEYHDLDIDVLCRSGQTGVLNGDFVELGIPVHPAKVGYFHPHHWYKLYWFMKKNRFDIVCDFNSHFAAVPLRIAKSLNIPRRVVFYRNARDAFSYDFFRACYMSIQKRLLLNCATHILSNSQNAFEYYYAKQHKSDHRFQVISNGIDFPLNQPLQLDTSELKASLGIPAHARIIGHVGNVKLSRYQKGSDQKNFPAIVAIAEKICKNRDDVYFLLCGNNVEHRVHELTNDENTLKHIITPGVRKDIFDILGIIDIFLFPSLYEGQPNALLEAMCMGVPFVASNVPSIKEHISNDYFDRLFAPQDIFGMSGMLEFLIDFPDSPEKKSLLAENMKKKCNPQTNFEKFLQVLLGVAQK